MHSDRIHKDYSPSQADRFFACNGSVKRVRNSPARPPSKWAIEGTTAHEVLEAGLRGGHQTAEQAIEASVHLFTEFDAEFKSAINDALDWVWDKMDELNLAYGDAQLLVEVPVHVPTLNRPGDADGHSDIAIWSATGRILYVVDYKHGAGLVKAIKGNRQVMQYAAGLVFGKTIPGLDDDAVDRIVTVIIQPRAFHPDGEIRDYETTPAMLYDYLLQLDEVIEACEKDDAALVPGEEQCKFCEARDNCPAIEAKSLSVVNEHFHTIRDLKAPMMAEPSTLDVQRLAYIAAAKPLLMAWFKGVEERIDILLRSGLYVPGNKLVDSYAKREWFGDENEQVTKLAALIDCKPEDLYVTKRRPLTDVEVMVGDAFKARAGKGQKKKAAEDAKRAFAYFTLKQSSGVLTVVPEDDERPAVNLAAQKFASVPVLPPPPAN